MCMCMYMYIYIYVYMYIYIYTYIPTAISSVDALAYTNLVFRGLDAEVPGRLP